MCHPSEFVGSKHAMGEWKARQERNRPMQGPPTEIQMLRNEIAELKARQADSEYASALTDHEKKQRAILMAKWNLTGNPAILRKDPPIVKAKPPKGGK